MSSEFRQKLERLLNSCSMENGSDTPDFILAQYLCDCLGAFDRATLRRAKWYAPAPSPAEEPAPGPAPAR